MFVKYVIKIEFSTQLLLRDYKMFTCLITSKKSSQYSLTCLLENIIFSQRQVRNPQKAKTMSSKHVAARIVSVLGVKEYTFSTVNRRHVAARIVSVLRVKEYKDMSRKHVAARIVSVPRVHSEKQMCRRQGFCSKGQRVHIQYGSFVGQVFILQDSL